MDRQEQKGPYLVVVESPAKAQTINKMLGPEYKVMATLGHLKDLPPERLGIDEATLTPEYEIIKGKEKFLRQIKGAAREARKVFIATDPDREGEAIGWHLAQEIGDGRERIYRVLFHEITRMAVREALERPTRLDEKKVDAQQARRILDRLVGYKVSPLLWRKVKPGLSAGRVQSVALRLICDREEEIQSFSPSEYWTIHVRLEGGSPPPFRARLVAIDGRKAAIGDQKEAHSLAAELAKEAFLVKAVSERERRRNPVPPFTTSKLQQEAYRKLGFSARKTMMLAQQLYEGIAIGEEGPVGLITYMRTDSVRVSAESIGEARRLIESRYGSQFLPSQPNLYRNRARAQDAHEAIRPTSPWRDPETVRPFLTKDQWGLYTLIWTRFLASQMVPEVWEITSVDIEAGRFLLRATGSVKKFPGFSILYAEGKDEAATPAEAGEEGEEKEGALPPLAAGERLSCLGVEPEQHFTQPPPRFTEATLVKELEEREIGRPSTYAVILSILQDRDYIVKEKGHFRPTDLGMFTAKLLVDNFPTILDPKFTAEMERQLDRVEEGEVRGKEVVQDFYHHFQEALERASSEMTSIRSVQIETNRVCERCGRPMAIRWGRYGKFLACTGYPSCNNTMKVKETEILTQPAKEEESGEVCEKCGRRMVIREGRFGRYLACPGYPSCKNTRPLTLNIRCPKDGCEGWVVERRTKKGRIFYGCSRYPECRFTAWEKPQPLTGSREGEDRH